MNSGLLGLVAFDRYFVKMRNIYGGFPFMPVQACQAYSFYACHCNGKSKMPGFAGGIIAMPRAPT